MSEILVNSLKTAAGVDTLTFDSTGDVLLSTGRLGRVAGNTISIDSDGVLNAPSVNVSTAITLPAGSIDSAVIGTGAISAGKMASTLDLSSKTLTLPAGASGNGMVLLEKASWTSNTASASFDVFDTSKYTHYIAYWYVNHAPNWDRTYLRFRNSSGDITSNEYYNNLYWKQALDGQTPTHNSSTYAGQETFAWLAGNGTPFNSHGQVLISIPRDGSDHASIRGISQLIRRSSSEHYEESFSSTLNVTEPQTNLTGFTIFGVGGNASYGDITVFGIER